MYLIRRDFGTAAATAAARLAVMPLEREGGQKQFIVHERPSADGAWLDRVLRFVENLDADLSLEVLARRAALSRRSLNRRFVEQVGTTPARYVLSRRIRRAQYLLETSAEPVEAIALRAGFGSPTAFRERFRAEVGITPGGTAAWNAGHCRRLADRSAAASLRRRRPPARTGLFVADHRGPHAGRAVRGVADRGVYARETDKKPPRIRSGR